MASQTATRVIAAIDDDVYLQKITDNIASFENVNLIASSKYATDIITMCDQLSPDILISDLSLENGNMTHAIKSACGHSITVIATASSKAGEAHISQSISCGAQFFTKNLDDPMILRNMLHIADKKQTKEKRIPEGELLRSISELLHKLKLPAHFTGYHYMKSAILHTTLSPNRLPDISVRLYSKIAEEFETNARHIERAIIRAVAHINHSNSKEQILRTILGYDVDSSNYTLSAKELIALISDQLQIKYFT